MISASHSSGPRRRVHTLRARVAALLALSCAVASGCESHEVRAPDHREEVRAAERGLAKVAFDTVEWRSDATRLLAGNGVYAASCAKCHGYLGDGPTPYALDRGLRVPSLVAADFGYAGDLAGLRRRVYAGHEGGMPTWGRRGAAGLTLRDVDAVSYYVLRQLREPVTAPGGPRPAPPRSSPARDTARSR